VRGNGGTHPRSRRAAARARAHASKAEAGQVVSVPLAELQQLVRDAAKEGAEHALDVEPEHVVHPGLLGG
jgi:hypothetical protein